MKTKIKEDVYLKDKVAKILFTSKETREFTEELIAKAIDVPISVVKNNLELLPTSVNHNINIQYSEADALYENNTSIINIEINYVNYKTLDMKNMKYVCHLMLNQMKINEGYKKLKPIYQICINNFDIFKKDKFIYRSYIMEETLHEKRNDMMSIIDINIDYLKKKNYTEIEDGSLEKLLYIFVCNDKEILEKIYKGDEIMKKVVEKVSTLTDDFANELYYDKEEIINEYSYDLGKEEGIEQGVKERNVEIAKTMIKSKEPIDKIIKYTGLNKEEIDAIINENNHY